ncbi:MAG: MerR family transcriptional regulator [Alphaproteobacteria bacterium]|nr:MerR family transcriptional regulator [Alphaproteobacteria bacterium]
MDNEYFVSINDVVKRLSVPAHTLRYWEKQFPTAIRPITGAAGRRYYRADTIEKITVIRDLLYKNGLTIAGVKKLIHDGKLPHVASDFVPTTSVVLPHASSSINDSINDDIDTALDLLKSAKELLNNQ